MRRYYQIMTADTTVDLEDKVEEMVLNGFYPTGGVSVVKDEHIEFLGGPRVTRLKYIQAVANQRP